MAAQQRAHQASMSNQQGSSVNPNSLQRRKAINTATRGSWMFIEDDLGMGTRA
jgi:hypothetical protein